MDLSHDLGMLIAERVAAGLKRKSIVTPSKWAENYRVMPSGPWTFKYHPWTRVMHDSTAELNVGMKAAQMGFTETVLNLTFYNMDVKSRDCLYVLPAKTPDASNFSAARFDSALELSPHLANMFSQVKNVGHKRAGSANLYIRGSKSKPGLKSVPVSFLVLDELAEFVQENISLAIERTSGQMTKEVWMISTPTISGKNIDKYFAESTQEEFFFTCPSCSKKIKLTFPDSMVITAEHGEDPRIKDTYLQCTECKSKLIHEDKHIFLQTGIWVPRQSLAVSRGFSINQLYSSAVKPPTIAKMWFDAKKDPTVEQEFYNSKLGVTHAVEGAKITEEQITECILEGAKNRMSDPPPGGLITMGVDVGAVIHFEIAKWLPPRRNTSNDIALDSQCIVLRVGTVPEFADLDKLMKMYSIAHCVIDAQPERRSSLQFAKRFSGRVHVCYYVRAASGKTIHVSDDTVEPEAKVDRTSWLDVSLGRFKNKTISLPIDTPAEYKDHIKALVRFYKKDVDGNPKGSYEAGDGVPDHYAHAHNYNEIAFRFVVSNGNNEDIIE